MVYVIHSRFSGLDRTVAHITSRPALLDSSFRRAATGILGSLFQTLLYHLRPVGVPSRRIQDILSINDDGVLFWPSVILSVWNRQGFQAGRNDR